MKAGQHQASQSSVGGSAAGVGQVADPALKRSFKGHKDGVTSTCFNPNLRQVVSGSLDGTVMVWNFKPMMRPFRFVGHKGAVHSVCTTPNGNTIVSASADQTIRVWSNSVEGFSQVIKSHSAPVKSVSLSDDGSLLLSGSDDKNLKVFQLQDRRFMFTISAHTNWVNTAMFSPDTRLIASGSEDTTCKLWDVTSKAHICTFHDHNEGVRSVKFHPDGTCIASGSADKVVKIFDIRSQKPIQHYDAASDAVNEVAFHPNGRYLLSSSADSTVKIWDLRQGHILYSLYGHEGSSTTCNFSPGGDFFTTSGADAIVNVWKSNLNELETEILDESSGLQKMRAKATAASNARGGSARGGASAQKAAPRPASYRGNSARQKASNPATVSQAKIQTQGSPARSYGGAQTQNQDQQLPGGGVTGSGEELALTLEKVVSQLDIISRTLHVLEQRVSMNEESVSNCLSFFKEARDARQSGAFQQQQELETRMMTAQLQGQQQMRYDLDQLKDLTQGVQEGLGSAIGNVTHHQHQQQERDFMLSRATLGRPGATMAGVGIEPPTTETAVYGIRGPSSHQQVDSLNSRTMQAGATIVTQFNRDNLDETTGNGGNAGFDEIDDLRRA